ncbi:MAG: polysaccharide deacetylase [Lachnoclostridium sp.]|nr:polysaccharide deacetylase [Lachnoclostridium sp.]
MELRKQIMVLCSVFILDILLLAGCLVMIRVRSVEEIAVSTGEDGVGLKMVALTFDDGPNKRYTGRLLDGLRERGVKATFFLMGECLEGNEELVLKMAEDGHLIGVHCMQHTQLTKIAVKDAVQDLRETKEDLEQILEEGEGGQQMIEYIRPPFGSWNGALDEAVRTELSMEPVFWDVDSLDWEIQNTEKVVRKVIGQVEDGDIILMHDEFQTSVEAAFRIIDNLMAKGYTFVTVNELMVD